MSVLGMFNKVYDIEAGMWYAIIVERNYLEFGVVVKCVTNLI